MTKPLNDKRLKFNAKKHVYKIGNKELRSVTSWIKSFFTPFDDIAVSKYVAQNRRLKGEKVTAAQVRKEWKAIAHEGTLIHEMLEKYSLGKTEVVLEDNLKAIAGMNVIEKLKRGATRLSPEVRIYSEELGLAGTIDLIVHHQDGTVSLVDWKTNRKLYLSGKLASHPTVSELPDTNMTHYQLQLNVYAMILEREYGLKVKSMTVYHLTENGAVEIVVGSMIDVVDRMVKYAQ